MDNLLIATIKKATNTSLTDPKIVLFIVYLVYLPFGAEQEGYVCFNTLFYVNSNTMGEMRLNQNRCRFGRNS